MQSGKKCASNGHAALANDDILHEILVRLPEKSVISFILISKRWLRVICSSSFRNDYHTRWRVDFHLLGFFVSNHLYLGRPKHGVCRPPSELAINLLSTCEEGDNLLTSGIPKKLGYYIDSSNGLLLFGRHPLTYSVWKPITKQLCELPQPKQYYKSLCTAFFTVTKDCFSDIVHYKVIRAKCDGRLRQANAVSIETYSSMTGTWKHLTLTCSSTFALRPWTVATVVSGVIYWFANQGNLAIYDPRPGDRRIVLLKLPDGKISRDYDESVLGESHDGLLQYGQSSTSGMEIWILEREENSVSAVVQSQKRWSLRYRLGFKAMWKQNPDYTKQSKEALLLSFLPQNSECVFIRSESKIYVFRLQSKKLEVIRYLGRGSTINWDYSRVVPYFRPSWPRSSFPYGDEDRL